jgi:NAD-dependent deacetylase
MTTDSEWTTESDTISWGMSHDPVEDATVDAWIDAARHALHDAEHVVVFTGAGVSAESGVPTFRGAGGLWREFRAEDLATPEAFARDPRLVWEWYGWRRELVARCAPNAAHQAIARFARSRPGVSVVTQNVDGLHQRAAREAGGDAGDVLALHGTLFGVRCTHCGARSAHEARIDASSRATLPTCDACGSLLRPDVVWFGESLEPAVLDAALDAARHADACLVVGTSALVQPAASVATLAQRAGAALIEVNAEATPLSREATYVLRGRAGELVPRLLDA